MPRPLKDDPRDRFKTFRFSEAEFSRLESRARASGRSVSAYVRMALFEGLDEAPDKATTRESRKPAPAGVRILAEQVRRIGVNLNQIAARLNERRYPVPPDLPAVVGEIRAYVRQVREP